MHVAASWRCLLNTISDMGSHKASWSTGCQVP